MMRWSAIPATALLLLATSAVPAEAQAVTATVVMKSGERHQGQNPWTRVDKGEFALRKSLHDQLRVSIDEVAYVDFGGASDAPVNLSGSQHAVVLRNGTVLRGQVIEMGHVVGDDPSSEYLITFRDAQGQERRLPPTQVGRVYFSSLTATATTGTTPATGTAQATGGAVVISARQQWTASGINVQKGETIRFNTTGQIQLSSDPTDVAQAAGAMSQRLAPNAPLPRAFAGALIGRIGANGQPFAIGNMTSVQMPEAGQLFLGINDDDVNDNQGEFRVEIQRTAGSPIRRR